LLFAFLGVFVPKIGLRIYARNVIIKQKKRLKIHKYLKYSTYVFLIRTISKKLPNGKSFLKKVELFV